LSSLPSKACVGDNVELIYTKAVFRLRQPRLRVTPVALHLVGHA
jgi:hypothetical protein